jgi:hypothetical protein
MCSQQAWMPPLSPPSKNQFSITFWQLFLKMRKKLWQNIPFSDNCVSFGQIFTYKKMVLWPIQSCVLQKPFQKQISKSFCKSTKQAGDWSQHSIWSAHNNVACLTSDWSAHWWCIELRRFPANSQQNSSMEISLLAAADQRRFLVLGTNPCGRKVNR